MLALKENKRRADQCADMIRRHYCIDDLTLISNAPQNKDPISKLACKKQKMSMVNTKFFCRVAKWIFRLLGSDFHETRLLCLATMIPRLTRSRHRSFKGCCASWKRSGQRSRAFFWSSFMGLAARAKAISQEKLFNAVVGMSL